MKHIGKTVLQGGFEHETGARGQSRSPRWTWWVLFVWLLCSMAGIGVLQREDVIAGAICTATGSYFKGNRL